MCQFSQSWICVHISKTHKSEVDVGEKASISEMASSKGGSSLEYAQIAHYN